MSEMEAALVPAAPMLPYRTSVMPRVKPNTLLLYELVQAGVSTNQHGQNLKLEKLDAQKLLPFPPKVTEQNQSDENGTRIRDIKIQ
jgi:hypothetical protein